MSAQFIDMYVTEDEYRQIMRTVEAARQPPLRTGLPFLAKLTPEFVGNAYHESSHAVVGDTLGIKINRIDVAHDVGAVLDFTPPKLGADDKRMMVMITAGWLGERLAKLTNDRFEAPQYMVDNMALMRERERLGLDSNSFRNTFRNCCHGAIDILKRKWGAVDRLAQKIVGYRGCPLDAADIQRAIYGGR
jgi:hypothetical protein